MMHLVEIDVVGLEAGERGIARTSDIESRELSVIRPVAHVAIQFRCEDRAFAPAAALSEPLPDDALGQTLVAPAVNIRGVKEVHALGMGGVHDGEGVLLARHRTEVHGSQADPTHRESRSTEMHVLHERSPSSGRVDAPSLLTTAAG